MYCHLLGPSLLNFLCSRRVLSCLFAFFSHFSLFSSLLFSTSLFSLYFSLLSLLSPLSLLSLLYLFYLLSPFILSFSGPRLLISLGRATSQVVRSPVVSGYIAITGVVKSMCATSCNGQNQLHVRYICTA